MGLGWGGTTPVSLEDSVQALAKGVWPPQRSQAMQTLDDEHLSACAQPPANKGAGLVSIGSLKHLVEVVLQSLCFLASACSLLFTTRTEQRGKVTPKPKSVLAPRLLEKRTIREHLPSRVIWLRVLVYKICARGGAPSNNFKLWCQKLRVRDGPCLGSFQQSDERLLQSCFDIIESWVSWVFWPSRSASSLRFQLLMLQWTQRARDERLQERTLISCVADCLTARGCSCGCSRSPSALA
eukprot:4489443-Amphidinium_carterae.1